MKKKRFIVIALIYLAVLLTLSSCEPRSDCYTASSEKSCASLCGSSSILVGVYSYNPSTKECCCDAY